MSYAGPETGLVEETLVWASEEFTWSKLRLDLLQNSVSANPQEGPKDSVLAQCVLNLCCWQSIHVLFRGGTEICIFCTTKPTRSIGIYFVSKMLYDCIIFNIVV